jgi:hypothetical protein
MGAFSKDHCVKREGAKSDEHEPGYLPIHLINYVLRFIGDGRLHILGKSYLSLGIAFFDF